MYQRTWYDPLIDPPEAKRPVRTDPPPAARRGLLATIRRRLGHGLIRLGMLISPPPRLGQQRRPLEQRRHALGPR